VIDVNGRKGGNIVFFSKEGAGSAAGAPQIVFTTAD
jgi:hypothetical protein